jgi:hypothetical protein
MRINRKIRKVIKALILIKVMKRKIKIRNNLENLETYNIKKR